VTSRRTGEHPAAAPRPPPLTALSAPASPWRPTHRYTSSGRNGRTQTQTQRTTDTRTSHKGGRGPQPSPVPILSRLVNAALRTQVSGCHGQRTQAISRNLPPVMQRWVGGHHATPAAPPRLMTAEGSRWSKEGGESGSRIIPILPQLISDLPEIHMHACQRQHRRGYPPALRRPRAAPSWARPHSW
jgi:hypothetical protein